MHHLEHTHRLREIAQTVLAEIDQVGALRKPSPRDSRGCLGQQHLPTVPGRHQPGAAVEGLIHVLAGSAQVSSNDVTMDHRGLIYLIDRVRGVDVIETSLH